MNARPTEYFQTTSSARPNCSDTNFAKSGSIIAQTGNTHTWFKLRPSENLTTSFSVIITASALGKSAAAMSAWSGSAMVWFNVMPHVPQRIEKTLRLGDTCHGGDGLFFQTTCVQYFGRLVQTVNLSRFDAAVKHVFRRQSRRQKRIRRPPMYI